MITINLEHVLEGMKGSKKKQGWKHKPKGTNW